MSLLDKVLPTRSANYATREVGEDVEPDGPLTDLERQLDADEDLAAQPESVDPVTTDEPPAQDAPQEHEGASDGDDGLAPEADDLGETR